VPEHDRILALTGTPGAAGRPVDAPRRAPIIGAGPQLVLVRSAMDARLEGWRLPRRSCRSDVDRASTPRRPDQGPEPGCSSVPRLVRGPGAAVGTARPGPARSEVRGRRRRPSRTPEGPVVHRGDGSGRPVRRPRVDLASLEGPRAARSSRRWVEARCVLRRSRSAAGGAPSEVEQGSACSWGRARRPSRRSRSPGEGGVTGHGVLERCAGRRPAAGCRGRAVFRWVLVAPGREVGGENRAPAWASGRPVPGPVPSLSGRTVPACGRTAGAAVASRWAEASVLTAPGRGGRLIHSRPAAEPADGARSGRDVLPARRGKTPGRERAPRRGKTPRAGLWGCWAARAAGRGRRPVAARSGAAG